MDTLTLLGTALGLGTLAGINLYLTVFVSGLAIREGWITLHPQYEQLSVLADPTILWISGILFALEFVADKVPWVDTLWDSVHTLIRPIGGAMLAITVLGTSHPVYGVIVGLLGGGMALAAHTGKAGARLLVNASPEPFSNIGLSLGEDALVVGGLALVYKYPLVALAASVLATALAIWLVPKIFRMARATLWFAWRRVRHLAAPKSAPLEVPELPPDLEIAIGQARGADAAVDWAAPCVTARGAHLGGNIFGWLFHLDGSQGGLDFVRKAGGRPKVQEIPIRGWKARHLRGWACDRVVLYDVASGRKQTFQFDRSRRDHAARFAELVEAAGYPTATRRNGDAEIS